jgi:hypothetical protein
MMSVNMKNGTILFGIIVDLEAEPMLFQTLDGKIIEVAYDIFAELEEV